MVQQIFIVFQLFYGRQLLFYILYLEAYSLLHTSLVVCVAVDEAFGTLSYHFIFIFDKTSQHRRDIDGLMSVANCRRQFQRLTLLLQLGIPIKELFFKRNLSLLFFYHILNLILQSKIFIIVDNAQDAGCSCQFFICQLGQPYRIFN